MLGGSEKLCQGVEMTRVQPADRPHFLADHPNFWADHQLPNCRLPLRLRRPTA